MIPIPYAGKENSPYRALDLLPDPKAGAFLSRLTASPLKGHLDIGERRLLALLLARGGGPVSHRDMGFVTGQPPGSGAIYAIVSRMRRRLRLIGIDFPQGRKTGAVGGAIYQLPLEEVEKVLAYLPKEIRV